MNLQKKFYKNKRIIVTGGTGLIGRAIVKKLCDFNAKVTVVSLDKLILDKLGAAINKKIAEIVPPAKEL